MSVQSEIDRIITAVGNAYSKVSEKGGTVPASQTVANLATAIDSIPSGGGAKETWVLNGKPKSRNATYTISFTSNGTRYSKLKISQFERERLKYGDTLVYGDQGVAGAGWIDQAYRKLTFDTPPTGKLLEWLIASGVKQPDDTAVQDTKALTITSNGTVSVTPDAPYDALKKVDVTVNVASGGGSGAGYKVTFPATAKNWDNISAAGIVQMDSTVVDMTDYSAVAGKTIPNVLEICIRGAGYYFPLMTVQTGKIMFTYISPVGVKVIPVVDGESSIVYMGDGSSSRWIPLADTVISAIELRNTD